MRSCFRREGANQVDSNDRLIDWISRYSPNDDETIVRSFLRRMLFSGDEALKPVRVLFRGERVQCLQTRLMLSGASCPILLFTSHDHQLVASIANRVFELCPGGVIDRSMEFDDYLAEERITELRDRLSHGHVLAEIGAGTARHVPRARGTICGS